MPLVRALRSVGFPANRATGRFIAVGQVAICVAALAFPGAPSAAALCLMYASFSAFLLAALRRGGVVASCGCFGKADTPPTRGRLAGTTLLAAIAGACAVRPEWATPGTDPLSLAVTGVGAALIAFLAWQVFSVLPSTTPAAIRSIRKATAGSRRA